jgi:hypothetical protein
VELIVVRSAGHSDRSSVFKNDMAERGEIRASTFWPSQGPQFPLVTRQATQTGASNGSTLHRRPPGRLWASATSTGSRSRTMPFPTGPASQTRKRDAGSSGGC